MIPEDQDYFSVAEPRSLVLLLVFEGERGLHVAVAACTERRPRQPGVD